MSHCWSLVRRWEFEDREVTGIETVKPAGLGDSCGLGGGLPFFLDGQHLSSFLLDIPDMADPFFILDSFHCCPKLIRMTKASG